jgi:hypothetical protein
MSFRHSFPKEKLGGFPQNKKCVSPKEPPKAVGFPSSPELPQPPSRHRQRAIALGGQWHDAVCQVQNLLVASIIPGAQPPERHMATQELMAWNLRLESSLSVSSVWISIGLYKFYKHIIYYNIIYLLRLACAKILRRFPRLGRTFQIVPRRSSSLKTLTSGGGKKNGARCGDG